MDLGLDLFSDLKEDQNPVNEDNDIISEEIENVKIENIETTLEEDLLSESKPNPLKRKLEQTNFSTQSDVDEPLSKKRKFEGCSHEVSFPKNSNGVSITKTLKMGVKPQLKHRQFPNFQLDDFQEEAICCIENEESVLVSAHTSAGKTVVAEYAIAQSLATKSRVIYTAPIKALSNQKYRDLQSEFGDVGLITGDVTISPNANCLVMTTEILRTMLYKGHELLTSVKWVIFDEVHYMRDEERGVVWEETIILLPNAVKYVFLSATIPNANEFASWVANLKNQPIHVIYTEKRPTPLRHYMFPINGKGIYLVKNETNMFMEKNYNHLISKMNTNEVGSKNRSRNGRNFRRNDRKGNVIENVFSILQLIVAKNYHPCIFFNFSRKECEEYANGMRSINMNTSEEEKMIIEVFTNAIASLNEEDRKLPQITNMLPLIKRGIGVHHSGLLPIMKEIIEILFQEGLIKCLFATETFAMGLNMPAKTCIFVNTRKWDGKQRRHLTSGEYIQMSGRAGRRGIDSRGVVICVMNESSESDTMKKMLLGTAEKLLSAFHLTFFTVLNLLRVEEIDPEYIVDRSFFKFQEETKIPEMKKKFAAMKMEYSAIKFENELKIESFYNIRKELFAYRNELNQIIVKPQHALPFLQVGRVVTIKNEWGWGIVLNFQKLTSLLNVEYVVDTLVFANVMTKKPTAIHCNFENEKFDIERLRNYEMFIIPIKLNLLQDITSMRIYVSQKLNSAGKATTKGRLLKTLKMNKGNIGMIHPERDMKIENVGKLLKKIELLQQKYSEFPNMEKEIIKYKRKVQLQKDLKKMNNNIQNCGKLKIMMNLRKMKILLRKLSFIDKSEVLTKKGKVAAEISNGDCIVLTELLFTSNFMNLNEETMGSILSCFVHDSSEKVDLSRMPEELQSHYKNLQNIIMKVIKLKSSVNIPIEEHQELSKYSPGLMEVTYHWLKGTAFYQIAKLTNIYEGSIVRVMRRLEELIRQLMLAVRIIGEKELEKKLIKVSEKLKRGIIFSASLYL